MAAMGGAAAAMTPRALPQKQPSRDESEAIETAKQRIREVGVCLSIAGLT
jgi:hypothetical protein